MYMFAYAYIVCVCLPVSVTGKPVKLSSAAEEVALFFAQMLDHEYTIKEVFRNNFFRDWRKVSLSREPILLRSCLCSIVAMGIKIEKSR